MTDYATMQSRIADEMSRSDLTTQIQRAIQSAIAHYASERFWFNEQRATAATQANVFAYSLPTDMVEIDTIKIAISGNDSYDLKRYPHGALDHYSTSDTGQPVFFTIYREEMRLYPTPSDAWTLTTSYMRELGTLSSGTDTNAWMVEGEELIRQRAKADVRINVLMKAEAVQEALAFSQSGDRFLSSLEKIAFDAAKRRTDKQVSVGRLAPTYF